MCFLLSALCASAVSLLSCEEKLTNYKPFLSGIEGMKTQTPAVQSKSKEKAGPTVEGDEADLVKKNDDGTVTLIAKTGRQLMAHILRTLAEDEKQQFAEQVLSEVTRGEYQQRGLNPEQAFETLKKDRKEISKLFNRMPMGEHSPNVIMEQLGRNLFRVRLTGQATKGLEKWTGFDMVLEKGNWRLRWFVS